MKKNFEAIFLPSAFSAGGLPLYMPSRARQLFFAFFCDWSSGRGSLAFLIRDQSHLVLRLWASLINAVTFRSFMFTQLFNLIYHHNGGNRSALRLVGVVVGVFLFSGHLVALLFGCRAKSFLKRFPRSYLWGVVILSVDFVWALVCMANMDMGEFYILRKWFLAILPLGFFLVLRLVREFLAARALGCLLLLVGGIVLDAAYLQPQVSRLLLPVAAYAWIIVGMYFVGMPYLLRDAIAWVSATEQRWRIAAASGALYGGAVLIAAVLWY